MHILNIFRKLREKEENKMKKLIMLGMAAIMVLAATSYVFAIDDEDDILKRHKKLIESVIRGNAERQALVSNEKLPVQEKGAYDGTLDMKHKPKREESVAVTEAKKDLAGRLGIDVKKIKEFSELFKDGMQTQTWPVPSTEIYNTTIGLVYDGKTYIYQSTTRYSFGTLSEVTVTYVGMKNSVEYDVKGNLILDAANKAEKHKPAEYSSLIQDLAGFLDVKEKSIEVISVVNMTNAEWGNKYNDGFWAEVMFGITFYREVTLSYTDKEGNTSLYSYGFVGYTWQGDERKIVEGTATLDPSKTGGVKRYVITETNNPFYAEFIISERLRLPEKESEIPRQAQKEDELLQRKEIEAEIELQHNNNKTSPQMADAPKEILPLQNKQ